LVTVKPIGEILTTGQKFDGPKANYVAERYRFEEGSWNSLTVNVIYFSWIYFCIYFTNSEKAVPNLCQFRML